MAISLKQLQKAVAKERAKAQIIEERRILERELKRLQEGKGTQLIRRFGRGFRILAKKGAKATGRAIVKARKFAEESGAAEGLNTDFGGGRAEVRRPVRRPRTTPTPTK